MKCRATGKPGPAEEAGIRVNDIIVAIGKESMLYGGANDGTGAKDAALDKIKAYAVNNSAPKPTEADYEAAGITGVDADSLNATNAKIKNAKITIK